MAEVALHPAADRDYQDAFAWYAKQDLHAALQFETAIEQSLERIALDPGVGIRLDDSHYFYRLKRFPYLVIYRVSDQQIWIVAFSHYRRDPTYWHGR
jgi:toxin ParE1/3/4